MITFAAETMFLQVGSFDLEAYLHPVSIIAIGLLVALLVQKELIRAYWGERARSWLWVLNFAIIPLLLTFGLIMALRLWRLLQVAGLF